MKPLRNFLALLVCLLAAATVFPVYVVTVWLALHFAHTLLLLLPPRSPPHRLLALWLGSHRRCWKCGATGPTTDDLRRLC